MTMPFDIKKYPPDWKEISRRVREREGQRCLWCGAPNGVVVLRAPNGYWSTVPDMGSGQDTWFTCGGIPCDTDMIATDLACGVEYGPEGQIFPACRLWNSKVVLTVAHLGTAFPDDSPGDKHDKMDVRDENLAALCQSCHLRYDHADHIRHAKETRHRRRAAGSLFEEEAIGV
jgi:hypothetical protein